MRVGVIGLSEGNGHPFSFSAIINGYSDEGFAKSGWPGIHAYLRKRAPEEFGFEGVRVTHAWTQDAAVTERLLEACGIAHGVQEPTDMLGEVDAVIIARDDVESHFTLAKPFLEAGLPIFVDKPLSLDAAELAILEPYLWSGQLMSCSGLRFAAELDEARASLNSYGRIMRIDAVVVNDWKKYGIHMLDAALGLLPERPVSVQRARAAHDALTVTLDGDIALSIAALGAVAPTFRFSIYGTKGESHHSVRDNFSAFRRTLAAFVAMARSRTPAIPPMDTLLSMRTIMAGISARPGGEAVLVDRSRCLATTN